MWFYDEINFYMAAEINNQWKLNSISRSCLTLRWLVEVSNLYWDVIWLYLFTKQFAVKSKQLLVVQPIARIIQEINYNRDRH